MKENWKNFIEKEATDEKKDVNDFDKVISVEDNDKISKNEK